MSAFLYQAAPFILSALIVAGLWLLLRLWKARPGDANALPQGVENITGITGLLAAGVSVVFSAAFAASLGNNLLMSVAFVCVFLAVQGAEFTSSFHLGRAWAQRNVGLVLTTAVAMCLGIAVSIIAGQSLIANRVDDLEQERTRQSSAFLAAQAARTAASDRAQDLAMDSGQAAQAQAAMDALSGDLRRAEAEAAQWANLPSCTPRNDSKGRPYTSRAAEACGQLQAIRAEAAQHQAVLDRWSRYQGAKAHASTLASEPLPAGAAGSTLPWIAALATVTGIPADTIKAHFNIVIAGMGEFVGLLFLFLWGKSRQERAALEGESGDQRKLSALLAAGFDVGAAADVLRGDAPPRRFAEPEQEQARSFGFAPPATTPATAHQERQGAQNATGLRSWAERVAQRQGADIGAPNSIGADTGAHIGADRVVFRDRERVPPSLSQIPGRGRVGKVDTCKDCGADFVVETYNGTRCKACAAAAVDSYRRAKVRAT